MGRVLTQKYTVDLSANPTGYVYWNGVIYCIGTNHRMYVPFVRASGFGAETDIPDNTSKYHIATDGQYLYVLLYASGSPGVSYVYAYDLTTFASRSHYYSWSSYSSISPAGICCDTMGRIYVTLADYSLKVLTYNGTTFAQTHSYDIGYRASSLHWLNDRLYFFSTAGSIGSAVWSGNALSISYGSVSNPIGTEGLAVDSLYIYLASGTGLRIYNRVALTHRVTLVLSGTSTNAFTVCLDGTYIYVFTNTGIKVCTYNGTMLTEVSSITNINDASDGTSRFLFADDHLIANESDDLYALRMDLTAQFTVNSQSGQVGDTFTFTAI